MGLFTQYAPMLCFHGGLVGACLEASVVAQCHAVRHCSTVRGSQVRAHRKLPLTHMSRNQETTAQNLELGPYSNDSGCLIK